MGIRLPQAANKVQLRQDSTRRISGARGAQLDSSFLDVVEKQVEAKAAAKSKVLNKAKTAQENLIKKKFDNDASRLSIIEKAKVVNTQGENTFEVAPDSREKLSKGLNDLESKIPEQHRHLVAGRSGKAKLDFEAAVIPHTFSQAKGIAKATADTHILNSMNSAVEKSANFKAFAFELADVRKSATEQAQLQHGGANGEEVSPESAVNIKTHADITVSKTIAQAIKSHSGGGRSDTAKNLSSTFGSLMNAEDKSKVEKMLIQADKEDSDTAAFQLAAQARAKYPDNEKAQKDFITNNSENVGKVKKIALSLASNNSKVDREQKDRENANLQQDGYNEAEAARKEGRDMDATVINKIPAGPEREAVRKHFNKGDSVTVDAVYNELQDQYRDNPEAFAGRKLIFLRSKLSNKDYNSFLSKQNNIINSERSQADRMKFSTDKAVSDIVSSFILKQGGALDGAQIAGVRRLAEDAYTKVKDIEGMTPQEARTRVGDALFNSDVIQEKVDYWWGRNLFGKEDIPAGIKEGADLGVSTDPSKVTSPASNPSVHTSVIKQITDARRSKGKETTRADLDRRIKHMESLGIDVTNPVKAKRK